LTGSEGGGLHAVNTTASTVEVDTTVQCPSPALPISPPLVVRERPVELSAPPRPRRWSDGRATCMCRRRYLARGPPLRRRGRGAGAEVSRPQRSAAIAAALTFGERDS